MKTCQNETVLTCYRNAVRNANTPIGHNIAFLRNTLGIDIDIEFFIPILIIICKFGHQRSITL